MKFPKLREQMRWLSLGLAILLTLIFVLAEVLR